MTIENDFLTFAGGGSALVLSQADYVAAATLRANGFQVGIAEPDQLNKVWRQASIIAAMVAQFIVDETGQPAIDDGTVPTLEANFISAIQFAAGVANSGGFINGFRNASNTVANRGTSGTVSAATTVYTMDGWRIGAVGASIAWAQAATVGSAPFALQMTGQVGVTDASVGQRIESLISIAYASRAIVFQQKVKNNSGASITPTLTIKHANSPDNFGATTTDLNAQALQACPDGATTVVSWLGTANAAAGNGLEFTLDFGAGINGAGKAVTVGDADVRLGSIVSSPEIRNITTEQLQCQRYLPSIVPGANSSIGAAALQNTHDADVDFKFLVPARVPTTGLSISAAADFSLTLSGVNHACTTVAFSNAGLYGATITASDSVNAYTANSCTIFQSQSGSASLVLTGAEL